MLNHYRRAIFFLVVIGSMFLNGWSPVTDGKATVPATIIHEGTKYVNCSPVKDYPFQTGQKTEILSGKAVEETGSRSSFWMGLSIADKILFTAHDKKLLYGRNLVGKNLKVRGYEGTGIVTIPDFITKEDRSVIFKNAFFVTEIIGWIYVTGYPVSETNNMVAENPSYFWVSNQQK